MLLRVPGAVCPFSVVLWSTAKVLSSVVLHPVATLCAPLPCQASDIGALQSATIRLHEHGLGAAWHLKQVEVLSKATGITAVFPHNGWVQKDKGQKEDAVVVLREASLGPAAPDPNAPVSQWPVFCSRTY